MQALVFGVLLIASVALAGNVDFTTCNSVGRAQIRRFAVSDCADGATECTFVKGQTYTFEIEGVNQGGEVVNALHYKVVATVLGIPITLIEGDACHNMTEPYSCPIANQQDIVWSIEKEIGTSTPSISTTATARIWGNVQGTNAQAWACASIRVVIRNAADLKEFNRQFRTIQ